MSYTRALGTSMATNFGELELIDPRGDYLAWLATVKQYGGTVATMPHVNKGVAAARYPVDVIYPPPDYRLNLIFHREPDDWSRDSKFGYYRAPDDVLRYTIGGGITAPQTVPGEPAPPKPDWYAKALELLQAGGWVIGGLVGLALLSYLPRRRGG